MRPSPHLALAVLAPAALLLSAAARGPSPAPAAKGARGGEALARQQCVACHAFAPPEVLPRASWRPAIHKMALILSGKGLPGWGQAPPPVTLSSDYQAILAWYESAAPAALPSPEPWPPPDDRPPRFVRRAVPFREALTPEPAVSHVHLADLDGDGRLEALASDMRQGLVLAARPYEAGAPAVPVAQVPHPSHLALADLDGDGRRDLLAADLGAFYPADHEDGAVFWIKGLPGGGFGAPVSLGRFPRVADAAAADFDGDGTPELLVAAFGWWRTGQTALLRGRVGGSGPAFERVAVDPRPGAIHAVPLDLDRDGKLDFVGLIAQDHESVVAFLGDGKGGFRARTLYAAPHPNWGSSGIQVVDLDQDGDPDVLATNGDMFDDDILKPYHGVQWLENRGGLRFEPRPLAQLAGAHRALAGDLDGDGDLDVAASAFTGAAAGAGLPALVWLEQVAPGRFERRTLAAGAPSFPALDVGDVDGDGDLDLVAGRFLLRGRSEEWLEVWENRGPAKPRPNPK